MNIIVDVPSGCIMHLLRVFLFSLTAFFIPTTAPQENCPGNVQVEVTVKTNEFVYGPEIKVLSEVANVGSVVQAKLFVTPQRYAIIWFVHYLSASIFFIVFHVPSLSSRYILLLVLIM
jgi:hypothetical protein